MLFSYNWLKSFFKGSFPSPKELVDLLTMRVFEVENLEHFGRDFILDIDVLPNRGPDCFSHIGIAREIGAILNKKPYFPKLKVKEISNLNSQKLLKLEVKNKNYCQRYTGRVIVNVKVAPSPEWIQEKLIVCGLRPINNIVDITNYVMLETGQPLHAFDLDKIRDKKIIVRRAKKGEKIITLDDETYVLDEEILVIADTKEPLAIAGIKGGKKAEITDDTKRIVLESANFNQKIIRKASRKLNLKTDASWRFEHGIDPNLTEKAINRAAFLISQIAQGKVTKGLLDIYFKKNLPRKIKLDLDYIERIIGVKIPEREILNILERLEFRCQKSKDNSILVQIPTFRLDILFQEDLIEEIARIRGLDKLPSIFPLAPLIPPERNPSLFWADFIRDALKEMGFTEVYNNSFIDKETARIFNYNLSKLIEVENPPSANYQYLRPSLIPSLLKNIKLNQKEFKDITIFEIGKIFKKEKAKYKEKRQICGAMIGDNFYQLKGVIDSLFEKLGIPGVWYDEYQPTPEDSKIQIWHPKICAEIKIGKEELGFLGEISPRILGELEIREKVVIFDLDFEKLKNLAIEEKEYLPPSPFPSAIRDLAILVPRETKIADVLNIIQAAGGKLVRDVDLFDIYEGSELPKGKKNLAFHIIYQAEDRTLRSKEIDKLQKKIIKALEQNPGWRVRK